MSEKQPGTNPEKEPKRDSIFDRAAKLRSKSKAGESPESTGTVRRRVVRRRGRMRPPSITPGAEILPTIEGSVENEKKEACIIEVNEDFWIEMNVIIVKRDIKTVSADGVETILKDQKFVKELLDDVEEVMKRSEYDTVFADIEDHVPTEIINQADGRIRVLISKEDLNNALSNKKIDVLIDSRGGLWLEKK